MIGGRGGTGGSQAGEAAVRVAACWHVAERGTQPVVAARQPTPAWQMQRSWPPPLACHPTAQIEAAASVVVVGGGSVGVEMAAEVAEAHPGKKVSRALVALLLPPAAAAACDAASAAAARLPGAAAERSRLSRDRPSLHAASASSHRVLAGHAAGGRRPGGAHGTRGPGLCRRLVGAARRGGGDRGARQVGAVRLAGGRGQAGGPNLLERHFPPPPLLTTLIASPAAGLPCCAATGAGWLTARPPLPRSSPTRGGAWKPTWCAADGAGASWVLTPRQSCLPGGPLLHTRCATAPGAQHALAFPAPPCTLARRCSSA